MKQPTITMAGLLANAGASRSRVGISAGAATNDCSAAWYATSPSMFVPTTKVFADHKHGTRPPSEPSP